MKTIIQYIDILKMYVPKWRGLALIDAIFLIFLLCVTLLALLQAPLVHAQVTTRTSTATARGRQVSYAPGVCDPNQISIDCLEPVQNFQPTQKNIENPIAQNSTLLYFTPLDSTVDQQQIKDLWGKMLDIVDIFVVLVLLLNGIKVMFSGTALRYARAVEDLPGVLLALVAANVSAIFIHFFLGLNNALCTDFYTWAEQNVTMSDPALLKALQITPTDLNFTNVNLVEILTSFGNILPIMIQTMGVILLAQALVRLFFIDFYIILSPIGLACWALPGKSGQPLTRMWLSGFISTVMVQFLQVVALIVSEFMIGLVLGTLSQQIPQYIIDAKTLMDIVHIAFLWFVIRIPGLVGTAPTRTIAHAGQAMSQGANAMVAARIAFFQTTAGVGSAVGSAGIGALGMFVGI